MLVGCLFVGSLGYFYIKKRKESMFEMGGSNIRPKVEFEMTDVRGRTNAYNAGRTAVKEVAKIQDNEAKYATVGTKDGVDESLEYQPVQFP